MDFKHLSINKTIVHENRERYCLHLEKKPSTNSLSKECTKECYEQFDWLHSKTVRSSPYMYERKICKGLEIKKPRTINEKDETFAVLNKNNGDCHDKFLEASFHENEKPLNCNFRGEYYDVNFCKHFSLETAFFL